MAAAASSTSRRSPGSKGSGARYGIRVNSIHPGVIDTPMLAAGTAERAAVNVPLQRFGAAADVAELVIYLASDESSFVSGAEIAVDGGSGAGPFSPTRASGAGRTTT